MYPSHINRCRFLILINLVAVVGDVDVVVVIKYVSSVSSPGTTDVHVLIANTGTAKKMRTVPVKYTQKIKTVLQVFL